MQYFRCLLVAAFTAVPAVCSAQIVLEDPGSATIAKVIFSPDGKYLVSCGEGVKIWDIAAGKVKQSLPPGDHKRWPPSGGAALSRDGKLLALVHWMVERRLYGINFWNFESGELLKEMFIPIGERRSGPIAFSPDGSLLALSIQNTVRVFDVSSGKQVAELNGHGQGRVEPYVTCVEFSPVGKLLATAGTDGKVLFWNCENWQVQSAIEDYRPFTQIAFAPDGKMLVYLNRSIEFPRTALWDPIHARPLPLKVEPVGFIEAPAFSSDGKMLALTGPPVYVWDFFSEKLLGVLFDKDRLYVRPSAVAFAPDGKTLAVAYSPGRPSVIKIYPLSAIQPFQVYMREMLRQTLEQHEGSAK